MDRHKNSENDMKAFVAQCNNIAAGHKSCVPICHYIIRSLNEEMLHVFGTTVCWLYIDNWFFNKIIAGLVRMFYKNKKERRIRC